jgi:hypothetical protein
MLKRTWGIVVRLEGGTKGRGWHTEVQPPSISISYPF